MINRLTLTNYRAFKDQEFRFKRLNIFVGKNNSGKSSALSALNVVAQTIKETGFDSTPLVLNGSFDQLGTFIDVVNGNHPRRKIGIEIEFDNNVVKTEFKYRTIRREIELSLFDLTVKGKSIYRFSQRKDAYDILVNGTPVERLFPEMVKRRPRFRNFWPVRISLPIRAHSENEVNKTALQKLVEAERNLGLARFRLEEYFSNFDSLSPFRDKPERTYLYSGETATQVGITGSNTATMLSSDAARRGAQKRNLIEGISDWFEYTGIAQGLSVVSLTPRHFEICLISNDGSQHNICDVGFGCSQVLPVLTSGLNLFPPEGSGPSRKILIVQEPEIHLHPNAQAAMGSFFVSLIQQPGQIFVETHSDNLILRIARHVALGDIEPSDVAIFYVSENADERVTEISLSPTGAFEPEFPEGFFPQRQSESLMLARAAMRRRGGLQRQLAFAYPES